MLSNMGMGGCPIMPQTRTWIGRVGWQAELSRVCIAPILDRAQLYFEHFENKLLVTVHDT